MNLSVQLAPKHQAGLLLANPVMTASGTFGYGTEYSHLFDIQRLGAIVCKGTTLEPKEGNPQPTKAGRNRFRPTQLNWITEHRS